MIYTLYLILGVLSFVPSICYAIYLVQYYKDLKSRETTEALNNQLEEFHFLELTDLEKKHFGRIVHNRRGNGILGALVATMLISVCMLSLCQLMGVMNTQQASLQRKTLWINIKQNVNTLLSNSEGCKYVVTQVTAINNTNQVVKIKDALNNTVFEIDQVLGYELIIDDISLIGIGAPVVPLGTIVILAQNGNSSNYQLTSTNSGELVQQAELSLTARYKQHTNTQKYYLNVVLNSSNQIIGCSF